MLVYACDFGSAARGDGDEASDIDLLLVHPPFAGEKMPRRLSPIVLSQFADALGPPHGGTEPAEKWQGQVDSLRTLVQRWTGNPPQVVDLSFRDWRHPDKAHQPLLNEIQRDRVELIRSDAITSFGAVEAANG